MDEDDFKLVELTVRVWVQKEANLEDVVEELNYTIHHPLLIATEISDWKEA